MLDVAKALLIGIGIIIGFLVLLMISYVLLPVAIFICIVLAVWFLLQLIKDSSDDPKKPKW